MIYLQRYAPALGRLFLVALFFVSAIGKLTAPAATKTFIVSAGLPFPDLCYWISIIVELGGGALFLLGYQTRLVGAALALYSLSTALIFHHNFGDANETLHFLKDVAIAGGFLQAAAFGGGEISLDNRRLS
ncbi:MAG: DoxX family protein [Methylocella sp.]